MQYDIKKFLRKGNRVKLKNKIPKIYTLTKREKEYLGEIVTVKDVFPASEQFSIFSVYSTFNVEDIKFPFQAIEKIIFEETCEDNKAVCPVCGYVIDDIWEYEMNDEDSIEEECPKCGTELEIELNIIYSYTTRIKGENDEI